MPRHLAEEVVRRQEHEVSAEVAIALHDVVLVLGRVLLVSGEDDEVVRTRERVPVRKRVKVGVRQELDSLGGLGDPGNEGQVPVSESEGYAEVEEGTRRVDSMDGARHVPAVSPTVAVGVAKVVGLPRVSGEHDRDARGRAEDRRADDERRVPDASVYSR